MTKFLVGLFLFFKNRTLNYKTIKLIYISKESVIKALLNEIILLDIYY